MVFVVPVAVNVAGLPPQILASGEIESVAVAAVMVTLELPLQPFELFRDTLYVDVVVGETTGDAAVLVKPFGPVQLYVTLASGALFNAMLPPGQIIGGVGGTICGADATVIVAYAAFGHFPFEAMHVYLPGAETVMDFLPSFCFISCPAGSFHFISVIVMGVMVALIVTEPKIPQIIVSLGDNTIVGIGLTIKCTVSVAVQTPLVATLLYV